jgi:hypothetical protein
VRDCAFKRTLDGGEKKITRCAFMVVPDGATYDVEAVKHPLNVRYANGTLLTVHPGDSVKAYNNMQCSVRHAATPLTLTGLPEMEDDTYLQALWQSTEDDSTTEDEDGAWDGVFGEKAQLGPGGGETQAA